MSARIIPYSKRNTADEYRRRRQEVLNSLYAWLLTPVYLLACLFSRGDDV